MKFGRYELLEPLAAGGMGEVFRARLIGAAGFTKQLALKRIYPHLSGESRYRELFVHEAKIVADLQHPNIVQVMDLGVEQGELFIAMELIDGADVSALANASTGGKRLAPSMVALIAFDVLEALDYAHAKADENGQPLRIVHRDVSPQNILVDAHTGFAKLCDFGISTAGGGGGDLRGKAGFMAPEQARQEDVDARADLFAVGAVMFELLSGRPLFGGSTTEEVLAAVRAGDVPAIAPRLQHVAPALIAIVERALAPRRDERHASAAELRGDIEELLLRDDPRAIRGELKMLARTVVVSRRSTVVDAPAKNEPTQTTGSVGWTRLLSRTHGPSTERLSVIQDIKPPRRRGLVFGAIAISTIAAAVGVVGFLSRTAERAPAPQVVAPTSPSPAIDPPPPKVSDAPPASEPTPPPVKKEKRKAETEYGFLTVNAAPWARVAIDGKQLGQTTPVVEHKLAAGKHVLTLTGPSGKVSTMTVSIRPHQTTTRVVDLREE